MHGKASCNAVSPAKVIVPKPETEHKKGFQSSAVRGPTRSAMIYWMCHLKLAEPVLQLNVGGGADNDAACKLPALQLRCRTLTTTAPVF